MKIKLSLILITSIVLAGCVQNATDKSISLYQTDAEEFGLKGSVKQLIEIKYFKYTGGDSDREHQVDTYVFDSLNSVVSTRTKGPAVGNLNMEIKYDEFNRKREDNWLYTNGTLFWPHLIDYNEYGQPVRDSYSKKSYTQFTYDEAQNLIEKKEVPSDTNKTDAYHIQLIPKCIYKYNKDGQLIEENYFQKNRAVNSEYYKYINSQVSEVKKIRLRDSLVTVTKYKYKNIDSVGNWLLRVETINDSIVKGTKREILYR